MRLREFKCGRMRRIFQAGKMCIGYIRCRRWLTRAFGLDAACSVRLTAASASEGKRMDTNELVLAEPKRAGPQRRTQAIAVWVRPAERAKIQRLAASSGLSMSVYLKTLGLSYEPKSVLDAERVGDLLKACGDLGRLGGVLKLWLGGEAGQGGPEKEG